MDLSDRRLKLTDRTRPGLLLDLALAGKKAPGRDVNDGQAPHPVNGSQLPIRPPTPAARSSARLSPPRDPATSFLPVQVVESPNPFLGAAEPGQPLAGQGVEIVLAQGRRVRVQAGFDRQTLAAVLAVLEARPC